MSGGQLGRGGGFGTIKNEFWLLPGCNLIFDAENSLGIKPKNPQGMLFGIKKIKNDLEEDGYSFGIALGNVYNIKRGGNKKIAKNKEPIKSAKVKNISVEYHRADGTFCVRKLSTDGQAAITDVDGKLTTYPIDKIKYIISAACCYSLFFMFRRRSTIYT